VPEVRSRWLRKPRHRSVPVPALVATAGIVVGALAGMGPVGGPASAAGSSHVARAALPAGSIDHIMVVELENEGYQTTWGSGSVATYLNHVLRPKGELLADYYATGHFSLDNYIAQVSGQSPTTTTQADCVSQFADVTPATPAPDGQVTGEGCVYPSTVQTIATQLDAKYPPNLQTHAASWRAYEEDMGDTAARDGGTPDATGGTDCAHPATGGTPAVVASATDQYATRHDPFVWFHSIIDDQALCSANVVPLGTLGTTGKPAKSGHLVRDLSSAATTPRFAFVTPNLCDDGHDTPCAGINSTGTHQGGLVGADDFLKRWMPTVLSSPAYRSGSMLVVITFDEADVDPSTHPTYAAACCGEQPGPNTPAPGDASDTTDAQAPGGGRVGALLLNSRYVTPGHVDTTGSYNHYSALRSYEDLLGLTTGGTDGEGHLGWAAAPGLKPFGKDVFGR
jgi:phosphatidylinositol-3-phosphatase